MSAATPSVRPARDGDAAASPHVTNHTGIYATLSKEHGETDALMGEIKSTSSDDTERRRALLDQLESALLQHAELEDAIFYEELAKHEEARPKVEEFRSEHNEVEAMLRTMKGLVSAGRSALDGCRARLRPQRVAIGSSAVDGFPHPAVMADQAVNATSRPMVGLHAAIEFRRVHGL